MWRAGVCLAVLALSISEAQQSTPEYGVILHRLKRHPGFYCDSEYGPLPPRPPFWPPPPPHYWPRRHHFWPAGPPSLPPQFDPPGLPGPPPPPRNEEYGGKPCDTCGKGQSGAVSNAQSNTGDAIAVAVAKASKN